MTTTLKMTSTTPWSMKFDEDADDDSQDDTEEGESGEELEGNPFWSLFARLTESIRDQGSAPLSEEHRAEIFARNTKMWSGLNISSIERFSSNLSSYLQRRPQGRNEISWWRVCRSGGR